MVKHAYLLVTDLHIDYAKANRVNYLSEILNAISDICVIAERYKNDGYAVNLMLLGDIFDGSLSNSSEAMQAVEILRYFCSNFIAVYAVVGNHEISYSKDNPFWFLVTEIQDEGLSRIGRYIQPRGLTSVITVPSTVVDGNTTFYFNHYGTTAKTPEATGVRIGLFHQNVGSNELCKMWGTFDDVDEAAYIQAYNYCFFGHMHLAKGKYYLNKEHTCQGEWLGTIGRTKVDEVDAENLEVNIPCVKIVDGTFAGIENNPIYLQSPAQCIDYVQLAASQRTAELVKARQLDVTNTFHGSSLLETLKGAFAGTEFEFLVDFLNCPYDDVLRSYQQTLANEHALLGEDEEEDTEDED